ncbi:MAG: hypothetical protein DMG40_11025 [Acidobacteria bacterium]|nr:MAG: hypothetical protein DMG40_11025 [Acidobacteriota bacterium]
MRTRCSSAIRSGVPPGTCKGILAAGAATLKVPRVSISEGETSLSNPLVYFRHAQRTVTPVCDWALVQMDKRDWLSIGRPNWILAAGCPVFSTSRPYSTYSNVCLQSSDAPSTLKSTNQKEEKMKSLGLSD